MEMGEASQLAPFSGALHELGHSRAERLNLLVENAAGRVRGQQHQSVGHPRADPGGIGPMHRSARGVELGERDTLVRKTGPHRKSDVSGTSVSVRVDLGGRRINETTNVL